MTTDVVTTMVASDEGNVNKSENSYVFAMLESGTVRFTAKRQTHRQQRH